MKRLLWKHISGDPGGFHLVRVSWGRNVLPAIHGHDYAEVFWLNEGRCLHRINGSEEIISRGDIVFIEPDDVHQLCAVGRQGFSFTNLAFPEGVLRDLRARFPAELEVVYPPGRRDPVRLSLGHRLEELDARTLALSSGPHARFHLERFLLNLIGDLLPNPPENVPDGVPDWLRQGILMLREPEVFARGVSGFVEACGRCPEHVARATRQHMGTTPTHLVTAARMAFAARELRLTSKSVTQIGMDCGYGNPARFFKVFRDHHGATPRRYRLDRRQIV